MWSERRGHESEWEANTLDLCDVFGDLAADTDAFLSRLPTTAPFSHNGVSAALCVSRHFPYIMMRMGIIAPREHQPPQNRRQRFTMEEAILLHLAGWRLSQDDYTQTTPAERLYRDLEENIPHTLRQSLGRLNPNAVYAWGRLYKPFSDANWWAIRRYWWDRWEERYCRNTSVGWTLNEKQRKFFFPQGESEQGRVCPSKPARTARPERSPPHLSDGTPQAYLVMPLENIFPKDQEGWPRLDTIACIAGVSFPPHGLFTTEDDLRALREAVPGVRQNELELCASVYLYGIGEVIPWEKIGKHQFISGAQMILNLQRRMLARGGTFSMKDLKDAIERNRLTRNGKHRSS